LSADGKVGIVVAYRSLSGPMAETTLVGNPRKKMYFFQKKRSKIFNGKAK